MTAVHLLAYAASKFVASRAERKAKELEKAKSQKISTIGTYGDSLESVVYDPEIHPDPTEFVPTHTVFGLGTDRQSISALPAPKTSDPKDTFATAYQHKGLENVAPMTLHAWNMWAQTPELAGPDYDPTLLRDNLFPTGQFNNTTGEFIKKDFSFEDENTSPNRQETSREKIYIIRGYGEFETLKVANEKLTELREAGDDAAVVESATKVFYDNNTTSILDTKDIADAAKAANNANKGNPVFKLVFKTPQVDDNTPVETPEPIEIYAQSNVNLEGRLDQLSVIVSENFGGKSEKQIMDLVDPQSYNTFIRSVARAVLVANTTNVQKEGMTISAPNVRLVLDPFKFLQEKYGTIAALPYMDDAINNTMSEEITKEFEFLRNQANNKNETLVVGQQNSETNSDIPPDVTAHVATAVPAEDLSQDGKGSGPLDMLKLRLIDAGMKAEGPTGYNTYLQGLYDYVPGTNLQEREEVQPKIDFLNTLFTTRVAGTGQLFYDVLQNVFAKDSSTYSPVERQVLELFMDGFGTSGDPRQDVEDKILFITNTSPRFKGSNSLRKQFILQNAFRADSEAELIADNKARNQQFKQAKNFLEGSVQSYTMSDGTDIKYGAVMGQVVLKFDGVLHMINDIAIPALKSVLPNVFGKDEEVRSFVPTGSAQLTANLRRSALGQAKLFTSFLDVSIAEQKREAARRGVDFETFRANEIKKRQELEEQFQLLVVDEPARLAKKNGFSEEQSFRLAMRGYYRFMAAYALASAMQGGTGGRTISDQDVLNFLKAFNQEGFFSDPQTEKRTLQAILAQIEQQEFLTGKLASGGNDAAAVLMLTNFPGGDDAFNLTLNELAHRVGVSMSVDEARGGDTREQPETMVTDQMIIDRFLENSLETTPAGLNALIEEADEEKTDAAGRLKMYENMYPDLIDRAREELEQEQQGGEAQ